MCFIVKTQTLTLAGRIIVVIVHLCTSNHLKAFLYASTTILGHNLPPTKCSLQMQSSSRGLKSFLLITLNHQFLFFCNRNSVKFHSLVSVFLCISIGTANRTARPRHNMLNKLSKNFCHMFQLNATCMTSHAPAL